MYQLLSGLSIVEASSFVASPSAGLYCAQLGAEVIRVDQIGGGPDFRRWPVTTGNDSLYWENLNRAKKSLALDLGRPEGRELLVRLVQQVGTFLTNFPAGGFLSHDRLAEGRSDLITARVMGWPDGSAALDYTVNNAVGYPDMTGPGPEPVNHVLPAWDLLAGAYAAFTLMAAINRRNMTGLGGEVRIPLSDVAIGTASNLGGLAEVLYEGKNRERLGNAVYGLFGRDFKTADGVRIMIVVVTPKQWSNLVSAFALGPLIEWIEEEQKTSFATDDGERFRHRDALYPLFAQTIGRMQYNKLSEVLESLGCVFGRYNTMHEAAHDKRLVTANPMFAQTSDNPSGFAYPAAGSIATIPSLERGEPARAPVNGEHSEEILTQWLKLDSTEFAKLVDQRVVGVGA